MNCRNKKEHIECLYQDDIDFKITQYAVECELTEENFYPPEDTRLYCSYIDDIDDGDNYADYLKYFYEQYENEIFD